uniref:(northern house mosquito) hypothetical protein n=1 Tax=Culex pipiens TaxID=7175 RepID=A0A8D8GBB2_CULPI
MDLRPKDGVEDGHGGSGPAGIGNSSISTGVVGFFGAGAGTAGVSGMLLRMVLILVSVGLCDTEGRRFGILNTGAFCATRLTLATLSKVSFGALVTGVSATSWATGRTMSRAVDCVQTMSSSSNCGTDSRELPASFGGTLMFAVRKAPRLDGVNLTFGLVAVFVLPEESLDCAFLS